jgi:hypothetical protein
MTELEQYQKTDSYKSFVQEREKTLKGKCNSVLRYIVQYEQIQMFYDATYVLISFCSSQARRESISELIFYY